MRLNKTKYIEKYGEEAWLNYKEKLSKYYSTYYQKNSALKKEKSKQQYLNRYKTMFGRAKMAINRYERDDKKNSRGHCTLTANWMIKNIYNSSCTYCGDSDWIHLGADRIDNSKPHTPRNCVCACGICNVERQDKYTVEEFKKYRSLHPRACDIPKGPSIELSETGALKKRTID